MIVRYVLITLFSFLTIYSWSQVESSQLEELDKYIESSRQQWQVPGMTVTIVKDGVTLLSKGYGVASVDSGAAVDQNTLFMLGSTTKAMTAAAMAMLVDEGKVNWTDRVTDHLPWFQLHDPYATRELTVKDLFTHNSGLGNTDMLWTLWDYSTEEIVRRIAKKPLSYSLRGGYTYQNIMYATAGLIIEEASGQEWSDFIHERIYEPLGMTNTCALKSCAFQNPNRAAPHYKSDTGIVQIIDSNADSIGSAGSAWSSSTDIQKWMKFVLDGAMVRGRRLISKENFDVLHSPQIIIPKSSFYPTAQLTKPHFTAYSLGWFLHDYAGEYVQFHTGSLNGSGAIIGLVPDHNLGVYVMVNLESAEVRHALMYKVFDVILGLGDRDWSTDIKSIYDGFAADSKARRNRRTAEQVANAPADISIEELKGEYTNDFLGDLTIEMSDLLRINCRKDRHITLSHWHHNTYMGKIEEYKQDTGDLVDFDRDANGLISFTLYGYEFTKK